MAKKPVPRPRRPRKSPPEKNLRVGSDGKPVWWKPYFAKIAENGGFKGHAAAACRLDRGAPAKYIEDHPELKAEFDAAMLDAMDMAAENLQKESVRRGWRGVLEPVYQGGKKVGQVRKFSDTLLMFVQNARGKGTRQTSYTLDLSKLSDEQLRRLADGEDPVSVMAAK